LHYKSLEDVEDGEEPLPARPAEGHPGEFRTRSPRHVKTYSRRLAFDDAAGVSRLVSGEQIANSICDIVSLNAESKLSARVFPASDSPYTINIFRNTRLALTRRRCATAVGRNPSLILSNFNI